MEEWKCQGAYFCVCCGDRLQAFDLSLSGCDGCLVFDEFRCQLASVFVKKDLSSQISG